MLTRSSSLIKSSTTRRFGSCFLRFQVPPRASFHSSRHYLFNRTPATMVKEFLCILPDKAGVHVKRMEARSQHLENIQPLVDAGKVVVGGAMLDTHPSEGKTPTFRGSMLIYTVQKEDEAWELIRNDTYVKSGVWDVDAAQVIPFKSVIRTAIAEHGLGRLEAD